MARLMALVVGALFFLSGCATQPILLRHPVSGLTAQCGPYTNMHPLFPGASPHWKAERECINDFQRQGYERVSVTP